MGKLQLNRNKLAANFAVLIMLLTLVANASIGGLAFAQTPMPVSDAYVWTSGNSYGYSFSDATGLYNISSLNPGNYTVTATGAGFLDASVGNVSVTAGAEKSNVNLLMLASGGISGHVTDVDSGSSLQFVNIYAYNSTGSYSSSSYTDSNGNYQIIENLATGTYNVSAIYNSGYVTKTISGVSVTAGAITNNVNIALDKSAIISGTVTDSVTSAVLEGIYVYALTPSGTYITADITNSSGKYTLNMNLGTGTYNISALYPANHLPKTIGGVAVVGGNQYTRNLALDPSGIISGRITSSTGSPLFDAFVSASSGSWFGYASTNETGYYRITDGLGTGTYSVFASYGGSYNQMTGVSVTQGSETSNINFQITLSPSGTIIGRVTNATSGNPIPSASVTAEGVNGEGTATTNSTGYYVIDSGLGTGTYNVSVSADGYVDQTQTGVSVILNQVTSNINFQMLTPVPGRISGHVQTLITPIPEFNTASLMIVIFTAASIVLLIKKLKTPRLKPSRPL